ncbi:EAL domain-containing protein [Gorillibacterium massiliense]|uniref:EAL domain-containing protein n=1 Tax=Gorillibacterium massiliense TaxID=1280390 RepID=UPI0004B6F561|nr:EAL domain-containing protein [Gorillibacterium massiliense]
MQARINSQLFSFIGSHPLQSYLKHLNDRRKQEVLYYRRLKELQKIMKTDALNTFFQPILRLDSGETMAYEALNRPARTPLFPNTEHFYDFVGQTNQVFLFECYCRNISLKRFIERYQPQAHDRASLLFINIHPQVLLDSTYHSGETLHLLSRLGIAPEQVVFELTEKTAVTDFKLFEKVLSNYRSQGFRIAIDDVGSGYNSLKTLIYLKPEFVKLDMSLIRNIDKNREQQQLVKLIIEYSNHSSTEMIAEGIETVEELSYIREHGVQYGQGYILGKPQEEIIPGRMCL